jgi:hypothetical protein
VLLFFVSSGRKVVGTDPVNELSLKRFLVTKNDCLSGLPESGPSRGYRSTGYGVCCSDGSSSSSFAPMPTETSERRPQPRSPVSTPMLARTCNESRWQLNLRTAASCDFHLQNTFCALVQGNRREKACPKFENADGLRRNHSLHSHTLTRVRTFITCIIRSCCRITRLPFGPGRHVWSDDRPRYATRWLNLLRKSKHFSGL